MVRDSNHRSDVSNSVNRRNFLKATSGICVGVGVGASGLAAAEQEGERVEGEVPNPDRGTLRVDESVKAVTPHYYLLTLGKDRVLDLVDKSAKDGEKRTELRDFLKDVWRNYQVQRVQDGEDVVISLVNDRAKGKAVEDEDKQFKAAAQAVGRGYVEEGPGDVRAQWNGSNHNTMTTNTCEYFDDLYNYEKEDIASHADDPDSDPCPDCSADAFPGSWAMPNWVKDKIETGLNKFAHHYGHYYDPNQYSYTMSGVSIEFNGLGAAPWFCEKEIDEAKNTSFSSRRESLGRATHYVQDVSVPLHSGMGIEQMNLGLHCDWEGCAAIDPHFDLHYGYENYVSRNLTSGENFIDDYMGLRVYNSNPVSVVQNCADISNDYSYEVFHLMMDNGANPDDWSSSSDLNDLNDLTENCLSWAGGYTHALINDVY